MNVTRGWFPGLERVTQPQRLFCFAHAGGGASAFAAWRRDAGPQVGIALVQPPGREQRWKEPAFARMDALVAALEAAILPELDRPFALLGHSLGGLVAFELARALVARGRRPDAVFVSAVRPPHLHRGHQEQVHRLPDAELMQWLLSTGGTQPEVLASPQLRAFVLPVIRADMELYATYRSLAPGPLEAPLFALGGETDAHAPAGELEEWGRWSADFRGVTVFPGGHFALLERPEARRFVLSRVVGVSGSS